MASTIFLSLITALAFLLSRTTAIPHHHHWSNITMRQPIFLLVGDSTTQSGSGWGDGFLDMTLKKPAWGINFGVGGATIPSYRSKGHWNKVLEQIKEGMHFSEVLVTIQFGDNDEKVERYDMAFEANLKQLVHDVKTAGGTPIVVTPMSRRRFSGRHVVQDLADVTAKSLKVAQETGSWWIDMNNASTVYLNAIGAAAAQKYNLTPRDDTHLNHWGSVVFGRLVSDLLLAQHKDMKQYTVPNAKLSAELAEGKAA